MRVYERLQYLTCTAHLCCLFCDLPYDLLLVIHCIQWLLIVKGFLAESIRVQQWPFLTAYMIYLLTGFSKLYVAGLFLSLVWWHVYGEQDFCKFKPSGSFAIGYKEYRSGKLDCTVFYPVNETECTVKKGAPYFRYGR